MARKSMIIKQKTLPKFSTRRYNRCRVCGRARGFLSDFGLCRICFRNMAYRGEIPGVKKSSW